MRDFTWSLFRSSDGFWVGKSSLRSWRQLALEQLDEQDGDVDQSNGKMNGNTLNKGSAKSLCVRARGRQRRIPTRAILGASFIKPEALRCLGTNKRLLSY